MGKGAYLLLSRSTQCSMTLDGDSNHAGSKWGKPSRSQVSASEKPSRSRKGGSTGEAVRNGLENTPLLRSCKDVLSRLSVLIDATFYWWSELSITTKSALPLGVYWRRLLFPT